MRIFESIDVLRNKYRIYGNDMLDKISQVYTAGDDIKLKVHHGVSMSTTVRELTEYSGFFNDTYFESSSVDGLLHDIGRFEQYLLSGTLRDYDSKKITGYEDHGQYGKHILLRDNSELLRYFIPSTDIYDKVVSEVVGEHTTISNPNYLRDLSSLEDIFTLYEQDEVLKTTDEELLNKLITLKLLIVREADSLELLQNIKEGLWSPRIAAEEKYHIHDDIWRQFTNFERIDMAKLKSRGIWTCNAGFLLRYSLLFRNMNFVGTLRTIINEGIVDDVFTRQINHITNDSGQIDNRIDPRIIDAYQFTKLALINLIETSEDGKVITSESKERAKQKTKRMFDI